MIDYQWFIQPTVSVAVLLVLFKLIIQKSFDKELELFKGDISKEIGLINIAYQVTLPARLSALKLIIKQVTLLRNNFQFPYSSYVSGEQGNIEVMETILNEYKVVIDENSIFITEVLENALIEFGDYADNIKLKAITIRSFSKFGPIPDHNQSLFDSTRNSLIMLLNNFPKKEDEIRKMIKNEINCIRKFTT